MWGGRQRRAAAVAACAAITVMLFAGTAHALPPPGKVRFSAPSLFPKFAPAIRHYVVRCHDTAVRIDAHASAGWRLAIGTRPYRTGDFSATVSLRTGKQVTVNAKADGSALVDSYHVRCLPDDFPDYSFTHDGAVSPRFFSIDEAFFPPTDERYAMVFDNHGVPLWWYRAPAWASSVLPNGTLLWWDMSANVFQIHRLDGSLALDGLSTVAQRPDAHDLQMTGNGGYFAGAAVTDGPVDTSAYGGSSEAYVINAELQQMSADGQVVWDWKSEDHISLAETGHRWPWVINHAGLGGYDVAHWNSIEPAGGSVIASFRNLDAVYKIRKSTGGIVWKLGGTTTPESLTVQRDPRGATLGAQHDARLLADGTLTVFDNRTNLDNHKPRAVRFRIDEANGIATLLESITDPEINGSNCCGSARRLGNGDWLIDWGQNRPIAGYRPNGERTFVLSFDSTFSYRAEPVPSGAISAQDLREGMNVIYAQSRLTPVSAERLA